MNQHLTAKQKEIAEVIKAASERFGALPESDRYAIAEQIQSVVVAHLFSVGVPSTPVGALTLASAVAVVVGGMVLGLERPQAPPSSGGGTGAYL